MSKDLDFIAQYTIDQAKVEAAMEELGFERRGKYYHHRNTPYFVAFISGPPSIGQDCIGEIQEVEMATGIIRIISPTDTVKDRLAAFYYWGDIQCLEQAILVSRSQIIDMDEVES